MLDYSRCASHARLWNVVLPRLVMHIQSFSLYEASTFFPIFVPRFSFSLLVSFLYSSRCIRTSLKISSSQYYILAWDAGTKDNIMPLWSVISKDIWNKKLRFSCYLSFFFSFFLSTFCNTSFILTIPAILTYRWLYQITSNIVSLLDYTRINIFRFILFFLSLWSILQEHVINKVNGTFYYMK